MSKNLIIVLMAVVVIGGGVLLANKQTAKDTNLASDLPTTESTNQETTVSENSTSRYVDYRGGVLDKASDKRRILYFYASWCPTCRPADADFRENVNKFPEDLVLIRVNYNDPETDSEEKDLARKYNVTYQHTFVQIDNEGMEIKKWNGGQTKELLENIK